MGLRPPFLRPGIQARMALSYVIVTAAAVLVVEALALGVILPNFLSGQDLTNRVIFTAGDEAERVGQASTSTAEVVLPPDFTLGDPGSTLGPGQILDQGAGLVVPQIAHAFASGAAPSTVAVVISMDGTVLASSYPAGFPTGSKIALPLGEKSIGAGSKGAISDTSSGRIAWAVQPVMIQLAKSRGAVKPDATKPNRPDGYVYVQAPVQPLAFGAVGDASPLVSAGLVVLLLALPVGALFGLLTTRGLVKRVRTLAGTTALVSDGDFTQRVAAGPADELGRLERNFNEMAERLESAVSRERSLAEQNARQRERNRIARELHDSISQDLFSMTLLASGLEKALPEESPLRSQVRTLVVTAESTNKEVRALLLELRPAALEEKGLVPALEELASAYLDRLGVQIDAELEPLRLSPAGEVAALRIAQEALANAVKHSRAAHITLGLHRKDGSAELKVADDGRGFDVDAGQAATGLGLRLMRERVAELGGSLRIDSRADEGSVLVASIPGVLD